MRRARRATGSSPRPGGIARSLRRACACGLLLAAGSTFAGFDGLPLGEHEEARLRLWTVLWHQRLVERELLEWEPREPAGAAVDAASGNVVVGTRDGILRALTDRGKLVWEFFASGRFLAAPLIAGDTVYAGCGDGHIYALDRARGTQRWQHDTQEEVGTTPVLADGVLYVSTLEDTLFAIDASTGAWKWHHRREGSGQFTIRGAARPVVSGSTVYAAYSDGYVAALSAADGSSRWEQRLAPSGQFVDVDSIAVSGTRLYAAAYSGSVLAVNAETGEQIWESKVPGAARVGLGEGALLAIGTDRLHALDPATGAELWAAPLAGASAWPPVFHRGLAMIATGTGMAWYDVGSGSRLRTFNPGSGVTAPPAVMGERAYVLSNGGEIFALDLD